MSIKCFRLWLLVLVGLLVTTLPPAHAATYYVAPSGGGGCSTNPALPQGGLNNGIACLNSGDTLIAKSGTYGQAMNSTGIPNGSSGARTIVKAEVKRGAVLNYTGQSGIVLNNGKHDITIDGFVLDGRNIYGAGGMDLNAQNGGLTNILLQGLEIKNIKADDFTPEGGNFGTTAGIGASWTASNVVIRDVYMHDIGTNCNGGGCCNECYGYGIYLSGNGYTLENSEFSNMSGWVVHGYSSGTPAASDNIVRNNYFHDTGGPLLLCQSRNQMYNNVIVRAGRQGKHEQGGIRLAASCSGQDSRDNRIYNNTIVGCLGPCIHGGFSFDGIIRNNICYQNDDNTPNPGNGGGYTIDHNLISTDPQFVNQAGNDYHLQSSSPAKQTGVNVGLSQDKDGNPYANPPSRGAYEFGPGSPQVVATLGTFHIATLTGDDVLDCEAAKNINTPKKTLASALPCGLGGSTFLLRGGTYTGDSNRIDSTTVTVNGGPSAGSPTTISAYQSEVVTLQPTTTSQTNIVRLQGKTSITLQNLILDANNVVANAVVLQQNSNVKILGGQIKNSLQAGVLDVDGFQTQYSGVQFSGNVSNESCLTLENSADGTLVQGSTFFNCLNAGIYALSSAFPTGTVKNVIIKNNIFRDRNPASTEAAIVVGDGPGTGAGTLVVNNQVWSNAKGVRVTSTATGVKIYHNTFYANAGPAVEIEAGASATDLQNNIAWLNGQTISNAGSGTTTATNFFTDPLFVSEAARNFHLKTSAPASGAINTGTPIGIVMTDFAGDPRPLCASCASGQGMDIGAFEQDVDPVVLPPVVFINPSRVYRTTITGFMIGR